MITQILDNLFLGNWQDAKNCSTSFDVIITVAVDSPFVGNYHFKLVDGPHPPNKEILREAIEATYREVFLGKKVLVHCVSGNSRSPTVILGYLLKTNVSLEEGLSLLKKKSSFINPNPSLLELLELENERSHRNKHRELNLTVEITDEERKRLRDDFDKFTAEIMEAHYPLGPPLPGPPKVVYCMMIYEERMDQVKQCVMRVGPYVDRCVIVIDDSVTKESKEWLTQYGCELPYRKWDNHFSKQRNEYLSHVNEGEWALVSDPDELHSESLLKDLRKIVDNAERRGINMVGINSHDILTTIDGKREETISDFFKNLLFKNEEGVRYVGVVHENLLSGRPQGWRPVNLDKRYYYEHFKMQVEVWERAARNFHIAGGGNNLREKNPIWPEYRKVIDEIGEELRDWPTMRQYLRQGSIHPKLEKFLLKHRNRNRIPDADTEVREYFKWYFEVLHPEENTGGWKSEPEELPKDSWGEIRNYVEETYMKVLGRHADEVGKEVYTKAILEGKIKREDLPIIFKASPEYKEKFGSRDEPFSVGAIVLAKNEQKRIRECLNHLRPHVDFLLVMADSQTTDKTIEIAKDIADAVLVRPFSGSFAEEKNYAQRLMPVSWVLHCDCDETFNQEFLKNIKEIIRNSNVLSFRFPRLNPENRDWPDYQVRLLKKENIEWQNKFSEIPFHKLKNKRVDQVSVKTLDEYPIVHSGEKKDWAKILGQPD